MAVFTLVSEGEAEAFLSRYDEGELLSLAPIAEGVENTNYAVRTDRGGLVLTLFEKRVQAADLPFCLGLAEHLAVRGYPTPSPVRDRAGSLIGELNGRPAAVVRWAPGVWLRNPDASQAAQAGDALARLNLLGASFALNRSNAMGPASWAPLARRCLDGADGPYRAMAIELVTEVALIVQAWPQDLPSGPVHADFFPDNVLYEGGRISGVIDFYFACTDFHAYDLAVAINAWGFSAEAHPTPRADLIAALVGAYHAARPLSAREQQALPLLCRGAAARFALTRLHDQIYHVPGTLVTPKDPSAFMARLEVFRSEAAADLLQAGAVTDPAGSSAPSAPRLRRPA